jgi:hypothetical protein
MRVGVGFTPFETRADAVVRLALRAEAAGVEAVGVAEGASPADRGVAALSRPLLHRA